MANKLITTFAMLFVLMSSFPGCANAQQPGNSDSQDKVPVKHEHTNKLIDETSPYLLQHAHNPVNWHPWGPEAFAKAKAENKPIFLSVGYSTCYWCHVMERESFEKEDVAKIINENFIPIKVDREERPEVDQQYMLATQLMTGRGGWPNSVWLTPEGQPWMAGTYFPREQFKAVLLQLADVWQNRQDDVVKQAASLTDAIKQAGEAKAASKPITQELIDTAVATAAQRFDKQHGGFGDEPKFPPHANLAMLIDQYRRGHDERLLEMVDKTLTQMSRGGVYDHLGGGFHRYSTDDHWLLPHFEKMLYDNGQLMRSYTDGYMLTKDETHRETVDGIFQWLSREMTSPGGAFYSAVDSESDAEEGKFYVWTFDEVIKVLGETDGKLFAQVYGVEPAGNFVDEASRQASLNNVIHLETSIAEFAKSHETNAEELAMQLRTMRRQLLDVRQQRKYPHLDDKVLSAWNGLMIEGLAYAGRNLENPQYVDAARRAADFLLSEMMRDGKLLRSHRAGESKINGYLNDYAFVAAGLIELYRATDEPKYLDAATELADTVLANFQDESSGGFYFTEAPQADEKSEFVIRSKNLSGGGNLPTGNGVMAQVLFDLAELKDQPIYAEAATQTLGGLSGFMWQSAGQADHLLVAGATMLDRADSTSQSSISSKDADAEFTADVVSGRAYLSRIKLVPGQDFQLAVKLTIKDGWHLYGTNPNISFVQPTSLDFPDEMVAQVIGIKAPAGASKTDEAFGETLNVYEGEIAFLVDLKIPESVEPGRRRLTFTVKTQACNAKQCEQPRENKIELDLVVLPANADSVPARHLDVFGK